MNKKQKEMRKEMISFLKNLEKLGAIEIKDMDGIKSIMTMAFRRVD